MPEAAAGLWGGGVGVPGHGGQGPAINDVGPGAGHFLLGPCFLLLSLPCSLRGLGGGERSADKVREHLGPLPVGCRGLRPTGLVLSAGRMEGGGQLGKWRVGRSGGEVLKDSLEAGGTGLQAES